ncbi:5-oxoprolinase, partial [Candidatus Marsarchaeota G1 archaeon OSP_B]
MLKSWEVVLNSCSYIAEEMGVVMRNTAFSPNIKDRLDMSAAITDCFGRLVAQAEHIPVHLGSMPIGVRNLISCFKQIEEGDVLLTNDPYVAGTHANDVTMA